MGQGQTGGGPGRGQITAGIHEKPDSLLRQPGQKGLPVRVKPAVVQMGMGVKQHDFLHSIRKFLSLYLTAKDAVLQDGKFFAHWV